MTKIKTISKERIFKLLKNQFGFDEIDLISELDQSAQLVEAQKRFYKLRLKINQTIHLTIVKEKSDIFEKANSFSALFPTITCKPLFYEQVESYYLFGQEFFEGIPIHQSMEKDFLNHKEAEKILINLSSTLQKEIKDSTIDSLNDEITILCSKVLKNLKGHDQEIVQTIIFPYLTHKKVDPPLQKRWTNGDLAGRNILVNKNKDYKIIDYEFARETHFYEEDWLRLSIYSSTQFQKNNFLHQQVSNLQSSTITYHYLNQIVLDSTISSQNEFRSIAGDLLIECLASIDNPKDDNSVITNSISKIKEDNLSKKKELEIERILNQEKIHFSNNLIAENEYLKSKILSIQNSLSWKLLTPIRRIQKRFRKDTTKANRTELGFIDQVNQNADKLVSTHSLSSKTSGEKAFDWIIPDFDIGSGGHTTIFRIISWLEKFGFKNSIWICGNSIHDSPENAKAVINEHFFLLNANVYFLKKEDIIDLSSTALICTSYHTCYYLSNFSFKGPKYYFVQDFEPNFSPIGTEYFLALETYKMGFKCITAGRWLANEIKKAGANVVGFFELAVDRKIFFHSPVKKLRHKPRIAIYSRSGTPRRLTELIVLGLTILHKKGVPFHAEFFGEKKVPLKVKFSYDIHSVLTPTDLGKLYRKCDIGCVFSATNYSLVPLEMMACGLPIVEFDGENTRTTYAENTVSYAKPTPQAIYESIYELLCSEKTRLNQIKNGLSYIESLSWEKSAEMVKNALTAK